MLEHLSTILATAQNGWAAFSALATLAGLGGAALIAAALVFGAYLPGFVRTPLIVAGAVILAFAGGLQSGQQRGAAAQLALNHTRAVAAERERADLAEAAARDIGAQAVRNAEEYERALPAKKESDHAADVHPDRDRIAVPRDLARGLRALQRAGAR